MQETQVRSGKIPHATEPVCHKYWACAPEPGATTAEARVPEDRTRQQEKPLQWEKWGAWKVHESLCNEVHERPAYYNEE